LFGGHGNIPFRLDKIPECEALNLAGWYSSWPSALKIKILYTCEQLQEIFSSIFVMDNPYDDSMEVELMI
jgi:hypothetical protein